MNPGLMTAPEIETERLRLRGFQPGDWQGLARFYADDTVMRHMLPGRGLSPAQAEERAKSNIHNFGTSWAQRGYGVWAVADRASGRLLGQCGLRYVPEADAVELLYLLNKTHWGRGLASEAGRAALHHGFGAAGLAHVFAVTAPGNGASQRVLLKLGFAPEGEKLLWERNVRWFALDREAWICPTPETVTQSAP
jgi:RimJ/RimL family protein N-acetyltransferase